MGGISIIKIITNLHKPFRFTSFTKSNRVKALDSATDRIYMLCPIISNEEAAVLIRKKRDSAIRFYFDCDTTNLSRSEDYIEAVNLLVNSDIVPSQMKWNIGVLIVDNYGWIYSSAIEDSVEEQINAIELDFGEVETLIKSTFVERDTLETKPGEFETKKENAMKALSEAQEMVKGRSLFERLDKEIQFVEIELKGLKKIQNKTISLKSQKFEFIDKSFKTI